jgi:hypothetical protein
MRRLLAEASVRWNDFFHAPCDTRVLAAMRIGFASLVLVHSIALLPDVDMFWSVTGMVPLAELYAVAGGFVPTLFSVLPETDGVVWLGYLLLGLHASLLLVGYRSRFQIIAVLVWLVSFQSRNPLLVNGQDAILRLFCVFLAFAPLGASFSLDDRLRRKAPQQAPYYPLRFVQIQTAMVLFAAGIWKLRGDDWTSGNALYYVTRLEGFWGNFPLPEALLRSPEFLRGATFATVAIELSVPVLIWIPRTRRLALLVALLFHASLGYAMNLFLFEPIMLLGWCSFLKREDVDWLARVLSRRIEAVGGELMSTEGKVT